MNGDRSSRDDCLKRIWRFFPILFLGGVLFGCESSRAPAAAPNVAVVKVERRDLSSQLEIASELLPFQEIEVYAKVSGYIKKLYIDWGTHVKEGALLAVLEIPELQQQLLQDQASVRGYERELERSREDLKRAESVYAVAHLTYIRLADVQKTRPELIAQEEIDVVQGKELEAKAGVSAAKASQSVAEQALEGAKALLEKDRAVYEYSRISAPFDGVVTYINAYTGALLPAGTTSNIGSSALCRLSQNNLLRLLIPVPERVAADVHLGESVSVQVSTLKKTFQGKIVRFSGQFDRDTRTMHTEVDVPNSDYVLVPGMYATVQIPLHTAHNVLTVPIQAVQASDAEHASVLVVNSENRIERRAVTVGLQSPRRDEIVSGLEENERILFGEQSQYKPGQLVIPKSVEPLELQ